MSGSSIGSSRFSGLKRFSIADLPGLDVSHLPAGLEVALGHVGLVLCIVDEHVVPRLVLGGVRFGHVLVPGFTAKELGIHVDDDGLVEAAPRRKKVSETR